MVMNEEVTNGRRRIKEEDMGYMMSHWRGMNVHRKEELEEMQYC